MGESSESIRARVQAARNIQLARFANIESSNIVANADMRVGGIRQFCGLQTEGAVLSRVEVSELDAGGGESVESFGASVHCILKLARTIVYLAGSEDIQFAHLAEALHASQSLEDHDRVLILIELNWIVLNGEA